MRKSLRRRLRALRRFARRFERYGVGRARRFEQRQIELFLTTAAPQYDLVVLGASTDRNAVSRLLLPPTFERVTDIDCDMAIVHRG